MIDFQAIRDAKDLPEIARRYTTLNRSLQGPCPLCRDGNDRFYIHKGRQRWGCRICEKQGDVVDLVSLCENISKVEAAKRLTGDTFVTSRVPAKPAAPQEVIRSLPDQDAAAKIIEQCIERLPGSPGLAYATSRGLSPETLARYRIGFDPVRWARDDKAERPALSIPWQDADGTIQAVKFRFTDASGVMRYTFLKGSSTFLFGANVLPADPRVVVVVEGELNAMSIAEALGSAAAVLSPGSESNTASLSAAAALIRARYSGVPVVLWFDKEEKVKTASKAIGGKPIMLRSPDNQDANDILLRYGSAGLREFVCRVLPAAPPPSAPEPDTKPAADAPAQDGIPTSEIADIRNQADRISSIEDYIAVRDRIEDAYDLAEDDASRSALSLLLAAAERAITGRPAPPPRAALPIEDTEVLTGKALRDAVVEEIRRHARHNPFDEIFGVTGQSGRPAA